MSKISYSSLDEVWGTQLSHNNNNSNNSNNNDLSQIPIQKSVKEIQHYETQMNNNQNNNKNNNQNSKELDMYKGRAQTDYEALKEDNLKMKNIIANMNQVERTKIPENNISDDFNDYRFNSVNKVNGLFQGEKNYTPFQNDLEKKYLQDKIIHLENEFRKYKMYLNQSNENNDKDNDNNNDFIEGFSNQNDADYSADIMDLIVLIIIGLILIFVMDSLFRMGKYIGSKGKI